MLDVWGNGGCEFMGGSFCWVCGFLVIVGFWDKYNFDIFKISVLVYVFYKFKIYVVNMVV